MSSMDDLAAINEELFSDDDVRALARKAVARLVADAKSGQLDKNRELAEVIEACIRHSSIRQIRTLKWTLEQQELNRPDLQQPT